MPRRSSDDRCPGVLRPFSAADGAIVRLRVPGGRVPTATLLAVTRLARDFGQPFVQVTSRGNLQLRGLDEPIPEAFVEAVDALGLLPSATHDRVRNVLAEPAPELDDLVARLDEAIRADAGLTDLSGRWVFALSVSTPWLHRMPYDVAFQRLTATIGVLFVGHLRLRCSVEDAPSRLVEVATLFVRLAAAEGVWNVRDLSADHPFFAAVAERRGLHEALSGGGSRRAASVHASQASPAHPSGGHLVLHLPLGMLDQPLAAALVDEADDVVVTPERSIVVRAWHQDVVPAAAERRLVEAGFVTDESSAATLLSACIGAPWCRRTATPTLEITRAAAELADRSTPSRTVRTHVVGCERACGRPASAHHLVVEPSDARAVLTAEHAPPTSAPRPPHEHERPNGSPRV